MKQSTKNSSKNISLIGKISFFIFFSSIVFSAIILATTGAFNALPIKIIIPIILCIFLITFIFAYLAFKKSSTKTSKIISSIFSIICSAVIIYGSFVLNNFFGIFNSIQAKNFQIESFYVLVNSDSNISSLDDASLSSIAIYEDSGLYKDALIDLTELTSASQITYQDFVDAGTALKEQKTDAMFIKGSIKGTAEEIIPDFNTKIIETINIKIYTEEPIIEDINISSEPFNILISGIDTYGNISTVSRSDVNMIATINPNTNKILLTSIPRDFYVQLHGTTGLKDKLTHAGIYGVDMSRQTLEDLFDTKIPYYAKVNFSSLIDIVDSIGGITVESDIALNLKESGKTCNFAVGKNSVDGHCALRFARERYSYAEGDRHRVKNQQEVLSAIITKMTSKKSTFLTNSALLDHLKSSVATNIPSSQIYKLVKKQLDEGKSWEIERISVDGSGSMDHTYSMPSMLLYVMIPNQATVDAAKAEITKTLANISE